MPFERTEIVTDGLAPPAGHYSHGIVASGRMLFVAGQVALDEMGNLVGEGDAEALCCRGASLMGVAGLPSR